MVLTIRKMTLQNFQFFQKYLENCKTTFIFVGSYFAERLWEKVRFLRGGNSVPQLSRIRNLLYCVDHDIYLLRDVRLRLSYHFLCTRFDLFYLFRSTRFDLF
jgi:hypothetical protein